MEAVNSLLLPTSTCHGSAGTNPHISDLQKDEEFSLTSRGIKVSAPQAREPRVYQDSDHEDLRTFCKFAVLTRRTIFRNIVTIIAANDGRAIQGVADFLTEQKDLIGLAETMDLVEAVTMPSHFQVIFRVIMKREQAESVVMETTPVTFRIQMK